MRRWTIVLTMRGGHSRLDPRLGRQADCETRTSARHGLDLDRAAVLLDDPVADRQAQAGPLADRLGGEERVEDAARGSPGRCPQPLSVTSIRTPPSSGSVRGADASPFPLGEQASMAFISRLTMTWCTLAGAAAAPAAGRRRSVTSLTSCLRAYPWTMLTVDSIPALRSTSSLLALVDPGEEAEVLDNPLDPPQRLVGAVDQIVGRFSSVYSRSSCSPNRSDVLARSVDAGRVVERSASAWRYRPIKARACRAGRARARRRCC